ncbi:hypothetical protein BD410DRAFT_784471 [Rickenella mellea]|uniref:Sodium/calcium exchanger membrane region domain-containing protein n=1 Tax=Rickenella mellea TaxID=50990 RepID=A0A4Y7QE00_9AGAM|nr:hypothetical protein BD410DRAFT_784471 [Rickenella mellea]
MSPGLAKLAFVVFFVVHCVLWSQSRYAAVHHDSSIQPRSLTGLLRAAHHEVVGVDQCSPISVPVTEQCKHVGEFCDEGETALNIPYLASYFCTSAPARPLIFTAYIVWLIFLFSTLGISASDFFCPNLATIADLLGLDENVAGVTFLAFGNGSPDVFSTFSAMRAQSGALAIGELLGAASFIVSCVVGSMCIIKEFRVDRTPFLRDVGFFTAAVTLLLVILYDHVIHAWEAWTLIALYVLYVVVVVVGSWWERRKAGIWAREEVMRSEYRDEEVPHPNLPPPVLHLTVEPYRDEPSSPSEARTSPTLLAPTPQRARAHSSPGPPRLGLNINDLPVRHNSQSHSHSRTPSPSPRAQHMPSFSLLGALEFRQVINALAQESAAGALAAFEHPVSPYVGGHYHRRGPGAHGYGNASTSSSRRTSGNSGYLSAHSPAAHGHDREGDPWDAALGASLQLSPRSPRGEPTLTLMAGEGPTGVAGGGGENLTAPPTDMSSSYSSSMHTLSTIHPSSLPRFAHTPASPTSEDADDSFGDDAYTHVGKRQRALSILRHTAHVLFPTLHGFREKSVLGMIASVLAAPAVLALTVTLPVLVTPKGDLDAQEKGQHGGRGGGGHHVQEGRLVDFEDFEEEGMERVLIAEEEVQDEMRELEFNKWLMAVQCALGPLFCVAILFAGTEYEGWILLGTGLIGLAAATLVAIFAERGDTPWARMARCFMGFFVAVVWIMAIADEVVNVLKTFGFIFGLSDAIIGLTVFAVGNSLADFVANISVAAFAPIMGFSACFGGPMLNILLGVGVSGTYIISSSHSAYNLHFSTTLLVSTVGLLALLCATLIVVPLNDFVLTKRWGICLIVAYVVIMAINVVVEIKR